MRRIFLFLYSLRAFILFLFLEFVAIWLIVNNHSRQEAAFLSSSSRITGTLLDTKSSFLEYFYLNATNEALSEKNARLLKKLEHFMPSQDTTVFALDSAFAHSFDFWSAKVINNSLHLSQNYITINKGRTHGLRVGMGVFNEQGVIGRVNGVSAHFSTIISLLHTDLLVSSKIKRSGVFGSTNWDGVNSQRAKLLYVPRHVEVEVGDTVVTSGFNATFPEGIPIGVITSVGSGAETNYLDISLDFTTDFSRLSYVYLVENTMREELDSLLRQQTNPSDDR
ncbi:Rod shape-determining protein MreC [Lunatimonas lonarensis]|uniref:Cell shape-determining protein MreC n=1 Tax=Lunatimonas lonarensis TaxID=1232681 RepID=R7ZNL4_9BACT|nr:rod shape-determining protein MreC [Lunatimonas lonarensis]EON75667.1 Rod shape-determining protein MreC [Lunatimonas lonarensis]